MRTDQVNFIPPKSMGRIPRYAGGGHGSGAVVSMEEVPIIPDAQLAKMEEDQILAGMEEFAGKDARYGATGFGSYFRDAAAKTQIPTDMLAALAEDQEPEFSQQENMPEERDQDHGLDDGHQGESPNSGHSPVVSKLGFKQKVYVASLDSLATIYEDNGSTVTLKTVHGQWIEVSKKDVQIISTSDVASDGEAPLSPRKRNQEDFNDGPSNQDSDSMSAFSGKKPSGGESYADRRRAKR